MISRCHITACLILFSSACFSQNWSVFNQYYRYNYKFDNSALVTQVIFADSVTVAGADSTFHLNRIGIECMGPCYTAVASTAAPITATDAIVVPNMPQFLQRNIIKYANGSYMLQDTAMIVIYPHCQPNDIWLFDSVANISATCISKQAAAVFGLADSIKTIVIGTSDTLRLSKRFGILQFPLPYQKNKYFRLVGIEKSHLYDSAATFGERVPNAWDFYRFEPGDVFCQYSFVEYSHKISTCYEDNLYVLDSFSATAGYGYSMQMIRDTCPEHATPAPPVTSTLNFTYTNLNGKILENVMYPGMIIGWQHILHPNMGGFVPKAVVKFITDSSGRFYKYAGKAWGTFPPLPNTGSTTPYSYVGTPQGFLWGWGGPPWVGETFGVGIGKLLHGEGHTNHFVRFQQTCAVKSGVIIYGSGQYLDLGENRGASTAYIIYPNPVQTTLSIKYRTAETTKINIKDVLGRVQFEKKVEGRDFCDLDVSALSPGIYLLSVSGERFTESKRFIKE